MSNSPSCERRRSLSPYSRDLYATLQVAYSSTQEEIRNAYKKQAMRHHPDKNKSEDTQDFRHVHDAYQILSDPIKRARYDRRLQTHNEFFAMGSDPASTNNRSRSRSRHPPIYKMKADSGARPCPPCPPPSRYGNKKEKLTDNERMRDVNELWHYWKERRDALRVELRGLGFFSALDRNQREAYLEAIVDCEINAIPLQHEYDQIKSRLSKKSDMK